MANEPIHVSSTTSFAYSEGLGSRTVWLPWHVGGRAVLKASAAETEGRFSQIEFHDRYSTSPPLHVHHNGDEAFYLIEGEIDVMCDGRRLHARTGGYVFVPRGQVHSYVVQSPAARLLVTYSPPGMESFFLDNGVPIVEGEAPPPLIAPDPGKFARSAARYHCEIVGPPLAPP